MKIGELARRGGVSVQTIRYYERYGLLQSPQRKPSRYRIYSDKDIYQLRFIRQAKDLGFSLEEIRHLFQLRETELCPCDEVLRIGEERLARLESEIRELSRFRGVLPAGHSEPARLSTPFHNYGNVPASACPSWTGGAVAQVPQE